MFCAVYYTRKNKPAIFILGIQRVQFTAAQIIGDELFALFGGYGLCEVYFFALEKLSAEPPSSLKVTSVPCLKSSSISEKSKFVKLSVMAGR